MRATAVLMTTRYLEEADALADRVVIIAAGRVAGTGTSAELTGVLRALDGRKTTLRNNETKESWHEFARRADRPRNRQHPRDGILVANAGGNFTPPAPIEQLPEDGWRATVDGNLLATFLTLKSFLPGMKERRRGTIITIGSAAGRRADPRSPIPYAAAKAGIALLTQDVAAQAGPFGIRVNCVTPETILTEGNQQRIPAEVQAALADAHPLKRLGTPQDVAHAVAFLASAEAAWISGVIVDVAGGAVLV
jgi:NAD(P)-dependent dehydrogenase (short-subunit alcohol dehydrogenase family)